MSTSRHLGKICVAAVIFALLLTVVLVNGEKLGIQSVSQSMGYENRLFDAATVHTIDIVMDDWDSFIKSCENEEYAVCSVVIDNEAYKNVGIRAKGNSSLHSVARMGSERYSFKIEFDHYDTSKSYYGLDKLNLNNLIQDNTMMKDYLVYQMMDEFGVDTPLCSYVYITVNGEEWGLYLAVEGVEDGFLRRNYGSDPGEIYKPDTMSMGGGPGNGQNFDMDEFIERFGEGFSDVMGPMNIPDDFNPTSMEGVGGQLQKHSVPFNGNMGEMPDRKNMMGEMDGFGMGSTDVKLQYIDDNPDSYSNIFDTAKTDISTVDKKRLIAALKSLSEGDVESSVDVEQVLRYFVVHNFAVNSDSYTGTMVHNYYLHENDGILSMIPWDYNLSFGGMQMMSNSTTVVNDAIDTPLSVSGDGSRPLVDWIFQSEEYTELYHQYFADFLKTVDVREMIETTYNLIAPYVEQDPTKFCTYENFELGVSTLKEFCKLRLESIAGQLDGSIPAASTLQRAEDAMLVDASDLTLSDMGSMSGMIVPEGFEANRNTDPKNDPNAELPAMPQIPPQNGGFPAFEGGSIPYFEGAGEDFMLPAGNMHGNLPFDFAQQTHGAAQYNYNTLILLGLSMLILLIGLVVAFRFKR